MTIYIQQTDTFSRNHQKSSMFHQQKQNINNGNRQGGVKVHQRKYSYSDSMQQTSVFTPREDAQQKQNQQQRLEAYINQLECELAQQKQKAKKIQQHTIRQQTKVLDQIELLQNRFVQVQKEKNEMKDLLQQSCKEIIQYKKVKGIADAMVNMMNKVDGKSGNYHDAWRWIKKVIWEYESIRKKGLQWKKAYDKQKQTQKRKMSQTFTNSDDQYSSQYERE